MKKNMTRSCVLTLLALFVTFGTTPIYASQIPKVVPAVNQSSKKLTGTISDDLGAIIGAAVVIKGTTIGIATDSNGNFTLDDVPDGSTLVISYIGYISQEIKYTGQTTLDVELVENAKLLDEIVVTALGIKKEKRALSYAMSEVKGEQLRTVPTQNLGSSLYGKIAGMRISGTAAGPMGGTKIQLRGVNSISGTNRPLIIVDGIPIYDTESEWKGRERNETQSGSGFNDINPEDIEAMSVLKGANAAALYGSRATNGVIIITTKKGSKGKGLGVDFSTSLTSNTLAYMPEYQNTFGQGTKSYFDKFTSDGMPIPQYDTYRSFGPRMEGQNVMWWDGVARSFSPQKDNFKDLFQSGYTNNNTIAITGGGEKASLRFSYANTNYKGFLKNMGQEKHNFNVSGTAKLTNRISVDGNVTYNRTNDTNTPSRIDRVSNYPMPRSERSQLYIDNYKSKDGYFMSKEMSDNIASANKDNVVNALLWEQRENRYTSNKDRLMGSFSANINIIDPLNLRVTVGTDRVRTLKQDKEMFKEYSTPNDDKKQGLYRKINDDYTKKFYEANLTFNKAINSKFDVSAMIGTSLEDIKMSYNRWESYGLIYNGIFSAANNKFLPSSSEKYGESVTNQSEMLASVYGSAQLAYNHYLYLDITGRNDWTSRLPRDSRSFFYPSFGLGFVFTDAVKLPDWLTYGKLRASYAIVGNGTPSIYFANNLYTVGLFDESIFTNSFKNEVPLAGMKPEKTYSWEFGLDTKFLDGRLGLDFAYFTNETRNQILSVNVPTSSGVNSVKTNAGTLASKGLEIQLSGTPLETQDFSWDVAVNFSYVKSELKTLTEGLTSHKVGSAWGANFITQTGEPLYGIYLKKWQRDEQGNKLVNGNGEYMLSAQEEFFADAMPKFTGGFNTSFRYKDFTLNASIDGQIGGRIVSFTNNYLMSSGAGKESLFGRDEATGGLPYYIDAATKKKVLLPNHNASAPPNAQNNMVHHDGIVAEGVKADGTPNDVVVGAEAYYSSRYDRVISEDNVFKNTYFKFRELSITYQVPKSICQKIKLQGLNISLIGSDLFYIYKSVPNVNPESSLGTSGVNAYVEYTAYPTTRNFGFSLKAKF